MLEKFAIFFAVFAVTYVGVGLFRRWSIKREMLDLPNERSSHSVPTPRGGGVVIFLISICTFFIYSFFSDQINYKWYWLGAAIVAVISLVDDIKDISPLWRLLFHGLAAFLTVRAFGGFNEVLVPFYGIVFLGFAGKIFAFLWIIWLINAYNFMDGIDGIAALQAVIAGVGWSITGLILELDVVFFYGAVLSCSSLGFLLHNWQPAKIFMGDVGSAFLGYTFAVLPLFGGKVVGGPERGSVLSWVALILVWFFVLDSLLTFFKRLLRGEKVWQAHREHIYQQLIISGLPHSYVSVIYGVLALILTAVMVIDLRFSLGFDKTVMTALLIESVMLLLLKQQIVGRNFKNIETKNVTEA